MFTERTSVGLDVHARSVSAAAIDVVTGELTRARLPSDGSEVLKWLGRLAGPVAVTYEAGPTGYWLARMIRQAGIRCEVAAPSLLPRRPGDRVKTDKRDALVLAEALRADQVTGVEVPSVVREDARDLSRTHDDARTDLMAARHRLSKMLLRRGMVYAGGRTWTIKHDQWLRACREALHGTGTLATFDDYYENVHLQTARKKRLRTQILQLAAEGEFAVATNRLACLRGISVVTGFGLAVEIGDWSRFTGSSIGAYLGLVPSENSSGTRVSRGPITLAGNHHARRFLVEAAWNHTTHYHPSLALRERWSRVDDPRIQTRAHEGNLRLARRRAALKANNKDPRTANTAIARELAGWCWSLTTMTTTDMT